MSDPEHNHPQSQDTDSSVHGNSAPVQRVDHHDHGNKSLAIVALVLGCVLGSVGITIALMERSHVDQMFALSDNYRLTTLNEIKRKYDLIDNDWMQMNAYLAANGVTKDANGFYVKDGKRLTPQEK